MHVQMFELYVSIILVSVVFYSRNILHSFLSLLTFRSIFPQNKSAFIAFVFISFYPKIHWYDFLRFFLLALCNNLLKILTSSNNMKNTRQSLITNSI